MIHQMPQYLAQTPSEAGQDYGRQAWTIRKSWLLTGRFIDVARLNDHMRRVGLKRLLGMLGYQILESEILNDKVKTYEELLDLLAYNASDVINLEKLFLHDIYQSSLQNKNQLLSEIPELIYNKSEDGYKGCMMAEYPEFAKMYEYICSVTERNHQKFQIILFTVASVSGVKVSVEEHDRVMNLLENAIVNSIRNIDVSTRYSSTQYAVLLMNLDSKETKEVATRIMTEFYRSYDLGMVELHFDSADLSIN